MTSTPRILTLIAAGALALGLSACSSESTPGTDVTGTGPMPTAAAMDQACDGDEGVTIVVDASALDDTASETWCYFASDTIAVSDALIGAGIETEGTTEYGDQVICRVDGLPSASEPVGSTEDPAYVEACESMPAAFAYWSLWVKPAGGAWDYAQEGLSTLTAEPGDSVALLFTLDGAPAAPTA